MAYSVVGFIAILIHLIVNFDVIFRRGTRGFPGGVVYFLFLLSVIGFHMTDAAWGILHDNKLATLLFVDTSLYFVFMALSILLWGIFISKYLKSESRFVKPISIIGYVIFSLQIIAVLVNIIPTIDFLFSVTENCEYSAGPVRYATLTLQIIMFTLISVYAIVVIIKNKGISMKRHIAICAFGIAMIVFVILQVFNPLLPMYSLGYLTGVTCLHTFVIEEQKVEKQHELQVVKHQVEIDALTGVKSKHAYVDTEEEIDNKIASGEMPDFALVVFDLNNLKDVNDTYGHEAGDLYIIAATKFIKSIFVDCEIYRIGGDEFVAILLDENYINRETLLLNFNKTMEMNMKNRGVVVSSGMSSFVPGIDNTYIQVFNRADKEMYQRKHELKEGK